MRVKPRYVVEHYGGSKKTFMWKKDIAEAYGINYGRVNQSLIQGEWIWNGDKTLSIKVRFHSCKDCSDYMLESIHCKHCYKDIDL